MFFDILSPYSYFAFETLCRYRDEWGLALHFKPVFLSAIMRDTGNAPPAAVAAKAAYLAKDLHRNAIYYECPIKLPNSQMAAVMSGSLPVQRMLVALQSAHGDGALERCMRALWQRYLVRDEDILAEESKIAALNDAGLDLAQAQAVLAAATQPPAKRALADLTTEALAHGAFGVPAIVFSVPTSTTPGTGSSSGDAAAAAGAAGEKAMIFGSDRFAIMAQLLNKTWVGPRPDVAKKRKIMSRL